MLNCGNHILVFSQKYLLEFNLTHSVFLVPSSPTPCPPVLTLS